jgi:hypothetical protein
VRELRGVGAVEQSLLRGAEDIQLSLMAGFDVHLAKPTDMDAVCNTLRQAFPAVAFSLQRTK